jgi:hypothetical protein
MYNTLSHVKDLIMLLACRPGWILIDRILIDINSILIVHMRASLVVGFRVSILIVIGVHTHTSSFETLAETCVGGDAGRQQRTNLPERCRNRPRSPTLLEL